MERGARPRVFVPVLFFVALSSSFAQFGLITSLSDVARHFGAVVAGAQSFRSQVGLSGSQVGLGLGLVRAASLLALPVTAWADHRGRRHLMGGSLLVGLVMTAVAAGSPGYWWFVVLFALARPLLTTASALTQVLAVEMSSTDSRVTHLAVLAAGAGVGAGLSALIHGLVRGPQAFRWLFAVALAPAIVAPWVTRRIAEPPAAVRPAAARLGVVPPALRPRLAVVVVLTFVAAVVTGPANSYAFVYGEGVLHLGAGTVAAIVTTSGAAGLVGLLFGRRWSQTLGRRVTVAIGMSTLAVAACATYAGGPVLFAVGYFIGIGGAGIVTPASNALGTEIFPHSFRATAVGWAIVAAVIGATAGLVLFGSLADLGLGSGTSVLRLPALITFVPLLPVLVLLRRLPETRGVELDAPGLAPL